MKELGEFNIDSGVMILTDPCYDKSAWCQIKDIPARNGKWFAFVRKQDEGEWGIRVAELCAIHSEVMGRSCLDAFKNMVANMVDGCRLCPTFPEINV